MPVPAVSGVHHVKLAVSDLATSRAWYESVLGLRIAKEFADDDGVVRGVAGALLDSDGATMLSVALRQNPEVAAGAAGFDPLSLLVPDQQAWVDHFAALDIPVETFGDAPVLAVRDPDSVEIRLFPAD